jgi:hypothetical protein
MSLKVSVAALVLAGVLGCASGGTTNTPSGAAPAPAPVSLATLAGEYALVSIDGHAVPYAPSAVKSGSFVVSSTGTFHLETIYDRGELGEYSASGTCYTEGEEVKMAWDGGGLTNLALRGDTVLLKREKTLYAYLRKR